MDAADNQPLPSADTLEDGQVEREQPHAMNGVQLKNDAGPAAENGAGDKVDQRAEVLTSSIPGGSDAASVKGQDFANEGSRAAGESSQGPSTSQQQQQQQQQSSAASDASNMNTTSAAAAPLSPGSTSEEEGMIREEDQEGATGEGGDDDDDDRTEEEEGALSESESRTPYGDHDRSSPRLPPTGSSYPDATPTASRRWGSFNDSARFARGDSYVPAVASSASAARLDRDPWNMEKPLPGTSRYASARPAFHEERPSVRPPRGGDSYRPSTSGSHAARSSSGSYRPGSVAPAYEERDSGWASRDRAFASRERGRGRSSSPPGPATIRDRRDHRWPERSPIDTAASSSPATPLSGPNAVGPRPPLYSKQSFGSRQEAERATPTRAWGQQQATEPSRWNRWGAQGPGRERESSGSIGGGSSWRRGDDDGPPVNRPGEPYTGTFSMDDDEPRGRASSYLSSTPQNGGPGGKSTWPNESDTVSGSGFAKRTDRGAQSATASPLASHAPTAGRSPTPSDMKKSAAADPFSISAAAAPPPPPPLKAFEPPASDSGWGSMRRSSVVHTARQEPIKREEDEVGPKSEPMAEMQADDVKPAIEGAESEMRDMSQEVASLPAIAADESANVEEGMPSSVPHSKEQQEQQSAPPSSQAQQPLASEDTDAVAKYAAEEATEIVDQGVSSDEVLPQQSSNPSAAPSLRAEIEGASGPAPSVDEQKPLEDQAAAQEPTKEQVMVGSAAPTLPSEAEMQESAAMETDAATAQVAAEVTADTTEVKETTEAVPPAVELNDAVKEAVVFAAAAADGKTEAEAEAAIEADNSVREAVDDEETMDNRDEDEDAEEEMLSKRQEERENARRAAMRRLVLSGRQPDGDDVLEKLIRVNRNISDKTTWSTLEPGIHGPPFSPLVEPVNLYEENDETERVRAILMERAKASNKRVADKRERLRQKYKALNTDWKAHCARLDKAAEMRENARKAAAGQSGTPQDTTDSAMSGQDGGNQPGNPPNQMTPSAMGGRSNRRGTQSGALGFGDAVRSEAEFLEILASLESADMQDPEARAARTATTVPDQLIGPDGDDSAKVKYEVDEHNGFVADPVAFYLDAFDPDYWSTEEKTTFARKYALWPKQFGKIASVLPNKTASQCVYYYYLTKHQPGHDYKAITAARNRNQKRKSRIIKPKKGRGSALMADLKSAKVGDGEDVSTDPASPMDGRPPFSAAADGALGPLLEESEGMSEAQQATVAGAAAAGSGTRKRRNAAEEGEASTESKRAKGTGPGRGGKRIKGQSSKANKVVNAGTNANEEPQTPTLESPAALGTPVEEQSADSDMAAAEALGALSGMTGSNKPAKKRRGGNVSAGAVTGEEDGSAGQRKSRQATSSYWSIQERAEFLKGIAINGKNWSAVADNLNAKSAAQARNYFVRNAEVPEFVEAAAYGEQNVEQPLPLREQMAAEWIKDRLGISASGPPGVGLGGVGSGGGEMGSESSSARPGASPTASKEGSPEPPRRGGGGMGIMSLLNNESPSKASERKKPTLHEWFGPGDQDDEQMSRNEEMSESRPPPSSSNAFAFSSSSSSSSEVGPSQNEADFQGDSGTYRYSATDRPGSGQQRLEPRPYLPEARGISAKTSSLAPPSHPTPSSDDPRRLSPYGAMPPTLPRLNVGSGAGYNGEYASPSSYSRSPVYGVGGGSGSGSSSGMRSHLSPMTPVSSSRGSAAPPPSSVTGSGLYDRSRESMPPPPSLGSSSSGNHRSSWAGHDHSRGAQHDQRSMAYSSSNSGSTRTMLSAPHPSSSYMSQDYGHPSTAPGYRSTHSPYDGGSGGHMAASTGSQAGYYNSASSSRGYENTSASRERDRDLLNPAPSTSSTPRYLQRPASSSAPDGSSHGSISAAAAAPPLPPLESPRSFSSSSSQRSA